MFVSKFAGNICLRIFILTTWTLFSCAYQRHLEQRPVDFQASMLRNPYHDIDFARMNGAWRLAEKLFIDNVIDHLEYAEQPRIPLYLHHIWLGSPLPEYAKKFRSTWIDKNPDWTFILWTDHPSLEYGDVILSSFQELQEYLSPENHARFIVMDTRKVTFFNHIAIYERAKNYGVKSDLIRYEALYNVGGLYVDTDFECLKSFDDLHHALDFYIGIAYDYPRCFSLLNGLMASVPLHPLMEETIRRLHDKPSIDNNSLAYTGPHFLTEVFLDMVPYVKSRIAAFPLTYFYPLPNERDPNRTNWIEPESYAVHHWKMSWQK